LSQIALTPIYWGIPRQFPKSHYFSRLRWSPDGRFILANGRDHNNRGGLYRIDVHTGDVTAIVYSEPERGYPRQAAWSPDGKAVFYSHSPGPIFLRELETGREWEIYRGAGIFALSPDGRWLAVPGEDPATKSSVLKVVAVAGGEARELIKVQDPGAFLLTLAWSADGHQLLFTKRRPGSQEPKNELWQVPVEGGEAQRLDLAMDNLREVRVHPDGRRLAFTAGVGKNEIWVMENFPPAAPARKASVPRR
jgi:dipeptidyl aminopeptidase/acylaminoacyl peptidase